MQFVIRPNRSLSWRGNQAVFACLAAACFGIAATFTAKGFWVILPFAGLEMLCLGAALYVCCRRLGKKEVISIDADEVVVTSGDGKHVRRRAFRRAWTRVALAAARFRGHPRRLLLGSHGRRVEVGACLSDREKGELAGALRHALADPAAGPAASFPRQPARRQPPADL